MKFIDRGLAYIHSSEFIRFVIAGGVNTLLTYLLYLLLVLLMPYPVAYTISYAAGIALSYYFAAVFVFRRPMAFRDAVRYPIVYVAQYAISVVVLTVLVERLHINKRLAPLILVICTVPVMFILSRWIIKRPRARRLTGES